MAELAHREKVARWSAMGAPFMPCQSPPRGSGITGDGSPGTIYEATAFHEAVRKHGRPTGVFERPGDEWSRHQPKAE